MIQSKTRDISKLKSIKEDAEVKKTKVVLFSFGFKYYAEQPPACDLRIDLRNKMKNPQSHLPKGAIGKDKIVIKTILESSKNKKYIESLLKRVESKVAETDLDIYKIGIGCRSGIHRSVVIADYLTQKLNKSGHHAEVKHINLKLK